MLFSQKCEDTFVHGHWINIQKNSVISSTEYKQVVRKVGLRELLTNIIYWKDTEFALKKVSLKKPQCMVICDVLHV